MRRIVVTEQILEEQLPAETIRNMQFAISTMKCEKKPTATEFINSLIEISEKFALS